MKTPKNGRFEFWFLTPDPGVQYQLSLMVPAGEDIETTRKKSAGFMIALENALKDQGLLE